MKNSLTSKNPTTNMLLCTFCLADKHSLACNYKFIHRSTQGWKSQGGLMFMFGFSSLSRNISDDFHT